MKTFFISVFTLLLFTQAIAQNPARPIKIDVRQNGSGEPVFYVINSSSTPYTISVEFYNLRYTTPPTPNPYIRTARPGRTQLLKLRRNSRASSGPRYQYRYSYRMGCYKTKPDDDIEYLLPVAEGKTTDIFKLSYVGELVNEEAPDDFYALGFTAQNNDTVFAARGGTVSRVVNEYADAELDNYFTANYNYIEVVHEDCTFGTYRHLKKGSLLVKPGDWVEAGAPLAQTVPRGDGNPAKFRFSLVYKNDDYTKGGDEGYWKYTVPLFRTASAKKVKLLPQHSYKSVHPAEVITQEMGWLERRRWKRKH
jgi:hypothetical protein